MRMYRLLMPAVTVAGALALAGCGGGSSTPGGPPAGSDPETLEFAKGGFHNAGDGRLLLCDSDDGCELTVKDGKVQETEAELTDAGFTITNRRTPPATETETAAALVSNLWNAIRSDRTSVGAALASDVDLETSGTQNVSGSPAFADGKVTGALDWDSRSSGGGPDRGVDVRSVTLEANGEMVRSIAGWKGTQYEGTEGTDGHGHVATFYSNQGESKKTPFATWVGGTNGIAIEDAANGVAAHVAGGDDARGFGATSIKITGFTASVRGNVHTAASDTLPLSVPGTINGAAGTFRCAADRCTSGERPTGAGWRFFPEANAMVETPDAEYVRFGAWLRTDKDDEWANLATVIVPTGASELPVVNAWTNTATYEGGAVGAYAINRGSGQAGNEAGHFTAKATLTANFTPATAGTNTGDGGNIKGTIDGFMVNGTQKPWKVDLLQTALIGGNSSFARPDGTQWTMTEDGDPADANGHWSGDFYNEDNDSGTEFAESVAGHFTAEYENIGQMRGAFGANEKK